MEETAELAVSRDAALTISQDIDGCHVTGHSVWSCDVPQEVGVVVVGDCTRVVDAERVEGVAKGGFRIDCVLGFLEGERFDRHCFGVGASCGVEEGDVICVMLAWPFGDLKGLTWDQRMQAVNGDKFFSEGVGDVVLVDSRAGNAADIFTLRNMPEKLVELLSKEAPPVCVQGYVDCWVVKNRGSPFDGVDLGHQSTVHDSRRVKQLITGLESASERILPRFSRTC